MTAAVPNSAPPTAILFDWGDTLVRFPEMTTRQHPPLAAGERPRELTAALRQPRQQDVDLLQPCGAGGAGGRQIGAPPVPS